MSRRTMLPPPASPKQGRRKFGSKLLSAQAIAAGCRDTREETDAHRPLHESAHAEATTTADTVPVAGDDEEGRAA